MNRMMMAQEKKIKASTFSLGDNAIDMIINMAAMVPLTFIPIVTEFVYFIGKRAARPYTQP